VEQSGTNSSVVDTTGGILDRMRARAAAQLSTQKARATDGLGNVAQAIRQSAEQFRGNKQVTIAQYFEKAGDRIDRLSTELRNRDVGELVDEVQRFARKQPVLFFGSAFAIGVIGARLVSSAGQRRHGLHTQDSSSRGVDYAGKAI
jgi:hypothetical protein